MRSIRLFGTLAGVLLVLSALSAAPAWARPTAPPARGPRQPGP